jgi:hypothetical protein
VANTLQPVRPHRSGDGYGQDIGRVVPSHRSGGGHRVTPVPLPGLPGGDAYEPTQEKGHD